ncbi:MAG: F-type H+-transporting ATPase subunit delta [Cognaticolwellia sp.]|jgi:F-type H+-transporting ATPase subunit delta
MPNSTIAERYARALVEIGQDEGKVDAYGADLSRFATVLSTTELLGALSHPAFSVEERQNVLSEVLNLLELDLMVANFIRLVQEKGRVPVLPAIAERYALLADKLAGRVRALVTTAIPLDAALSAQVKASLEAATGKTILIDPQVDPEILGGLVAQVEGRVYDASLRTRLLNLRQTLLATTPDQVN